MAPPNPQELSVEIFAHLRNFALSGGSHAFIEVSKQTILDECEKLAKVNAIEASILKANLYALVGDANNCEYWVRNAEKIGGKFRAAGMRTWFFALLGDVSESYKHVDAAIAQAPTDGLMAIQLAGFGMIRKAEEILSRTKADIEPSTRQEIAKADSYLQKLNLSDQQVCAVMDVALGFLREKGLIWLGKLPDFHFLPSSAGGPIVSLTYHLSVPYAEASALNAELVDRIVAADLDTLGLLIGLRGSEVKTPQAFSLA